MKKVGKKGKLKMVILVDRDKEIIFPFKEIYRIERRGKNIFIYLRLSVAGKEKIDVEVKEYEREDEALKVFNKIVENFENEKKVCYL